jgi:hypothetical protein
MPDLPLSQEPARAYTKAPRHPPLLSPVPEPAGRYTPLNTPTPPAGGRKGHQYAGTTPSTPPLPVPQSPPPGNQRHPLPSPHRAREAGQARKHRSRVHPRGVAGGDCGDRCPRGDRDTRVPVASR